MKIIHITPTFFDGSSIIGGGERYPTELTRWLSKLADVTLVTFSSLRRTTKVDNLKVEVFPVNYLLQGVKANPLSFSFLQTIFGADIIHVHQISTMVSDLACLGGSLLGKRVFVTDHGGGGGILLHRKLPILERYTGAIAYSRYVGKMYPEVLRPKAIFIKGGIDTDRFCYNRDLVKQKKILFVGRLLPHKGVNYLIEAFKQLGRDDFKLVILGKASDERYYADLQKLAEGQAVEFVHDADDARLLFEYQTAYATVLPSVHTTCYGEYTLVPELMGFTLLESQACGTPVICTDAGAMHEFVEVGETGFVVAQNSGEALKEAIERIINLPSDTYSRWQERCTTWVKAMSWENVAQQHLEAYKSVL